MWELFCVSMLIAFTAPAHLAIAGTLGSRVSYEASKHLSWHILCTPSWSNMLWGD